MRDQKNRIKSASHWKRQTLECYYDDMITCENLAKKMIFVFGAKSRMVVYQEASMENAVKFRRLLLSTNGIIWC